MSQTAYDTYMEGSILSADPVQLIQMLYRGCSGAVREARRLLEEGDIAGRSRAISRAHEILTELTTSLDREKGGEIAERLALLYDYMRRRLIEANFKQEAAPLEEISGLLATLAEAWDGVREQTRAPEPAANPWGQPAETEPEAATASSHAWSF